MGTVLKPNCPNNCRQQQPGALGLLLNELSICVKKFALQVGAPGFLFVWPQLSKGKRKVISLLIKMSQGFVGNCILLTLENTVFCLAWF